MEKLYLQDSMLTGQIPSQIGQLTLMRRFKLQNNNFSCSIPLELEELASNHALEHVDLGGNNLISGVIPEGLCPVTDDFDGKFDCSATLCGCDCACT
ncbi:expressed unknown protein [Seminavis robusta]|uniref:Uncharacterized protein n=1 Tax=Seminavis robusta TaxID=568900 RepID=A0A9N8E830_9STRA|nr:expressed unknown protein [Seminavis robusta]|eukprot:Sro722_g192890.1 n/a (97) ;mRNA; r:27870-28160